MTAEKNHPFLYLDREDIRSIHENLSEWAKQQGEPIPSFSTAKQGDIDALVSAPQHRFFGVEAYPSIEEKAAIIFYTVNKRQIFLNGNKRMSTLCLLVFLGINDMMFTVSDDELTAKALWLANTASLEFPAVKQDLVLWIRRNLASVRKS
jgi:death-on-curing family protein